MLNSRWIVLLSGAFVAGAACGGRTGDDLLADGYGGAITGFGGGIGQGGFGGGIGGKGGFVGSGGKGAGGFGKGTGGFGKGTGGFCSTSNCGACNSCFESCLCGWDFDPSFASTCQVACNGAGGSPATGGFPNTGGTCSSYCGGSSVGGPSWTFTSCCAASPWSCGWQSDPSSSIQTVGCFMIEGGSFDDECPRFSNAEGCCRSSGTCGLDMSQFGLGCVPFTGAAGTKCDGISGAGGAGGAGGGGSGGKGAGGFTTGGAGGFPAGGTGSGPSVDQCVDGARSECEVCACKSCFDPFLSCYQNEGCPFILQCVNLTGCTGPDCLNPNTCLDVIERYGGIGSQATQLAVPLFACLRGAGCSCGFGF